MPTSAGLRLSLHAAFAWTGAAVFGGSLLYFGYSYLVRFGATGSGSVGVPLLGDVLLFTVFALHHSVCARSGVKHAVRRVVPAHLERSFYTWTASVLFLLVCAAWRTVPGVAWQLAGPWRPAGYAVQIAGLVLTLRGSSRLDVLDLAGVRQVQRARSGRPPAHVPLETTGLYGLVRHPLYFAWALVVFGAPEMTATRLTFAAVSTLYLAAAIPFEERSLIDTFGAEYASYRRKVRWRMLPGLY